MSRKALAYQDFKGVINLADARDSSYSAPFHHLFYSSGQPVNDHYSTFVTNTLGGS